MFLSRRLCLPVEGLRFYRGQCGVTETCIVPLLPYQTEAVGAGGPSDTAPPRRMFCGPTQPQRHTRASRQILVPLGVLWGERTLLHITRPTSIQSNHEFCLVFAAFDFFWSTFAVEINSPVKESVACSAGREPVKHHMLNVLGSA